MPEKSKLNSGWLPRRSRNLLLVIILAAVLLRVGAAFYLGGDVTDQPGTADQISYHTLAQRLLEGHGFSFGEPWWPVTAANAPTAHWSFLYTGFLAAVYALFGADPLIARLIQAVFAGILQPLAAYALGRKVFGETAGLFAAALTAFYAYFIYYSATLMTETFYILAILASFLLALRITEKVRSTSVSVRERIVLGLLFGLSIAAAVLLRQLYLLFAPFLFLWVLLAGRRAILSLVIAGALILTVILPFTAYNYARFGRFVLLNTNAGYAFFWGNHPIYGTHFQPILPEKMGSYGDLIPDELRNLDEAALDQALLKRGIGFIVDDPQRYVLLSLSRIPSYFMFWPSPESRGISNLARVASFGLLWPVMLLGLLIAPFSRYRSRLKPSPLLLLYGFAFIYTLIHVLTWTLIRYRLPVDAVLLLFAGLAITEVGERLPVVRRWLQPIKEAQDAA